MILTKPLDRKLQFAMLASIYLKKDGEVIMLRADIVNGLLAMSNKLVERAESATVRDWFALAGFVTMTYILYDKFLSHPSTVPTTAEQNMANHANQHLRGAVIKVFNNLEQANLGEALALCTEALRIFNVEIGSQRRLAGLIEYKKLHAELHFLRAQVLYLQHSYQEAAAELKRAVGYYKEYTPALNFLAHIYINHFKDLHQAKEYLLLSNTELQKQLFVDFYRALEADRQDELSQLADILLNRYIAHHAFHYDDKTEDKMETSLHRIIAPAMLLKWLERTAKYETNAVNLGALIHKIETILNNRYMMEFEASRVQLKEMQLIAYQRIAELKALRDFDVTDDKTLNEKCLFVSDAAPLNQQVMFDSGEALLSPASNRVSQEVSAPVKLYFVPLDTDKLDQDAKSFNESQLQLLMEFLRQNEVQDMARMIRCCLQHQYLDVRGNEDLERAKELLEELALCGDDPEDKQAEILTLCGTPSAINYVLENQLNPKNGWKLWLQPLHIGKQTMSFLHVACAIANTNVDVYECSAEGSNELKVSSVMHPGEGVSGTLSLLYSPEKDAYQVLREIISPKQLANELGASVAWKILLEDSNNVRATTLLAGKGCDLPPRREVEAPYVPANRRSIFMPLAVGSVLAAGVYTAYVYSKN